MLGNENGTNRKRCLTYCRLYVRRESTFGHYRIIYSKIMRSTWAWVSLALVASLVTSSEAFYTSGGYKAPSPCGGLDISGAIASGAEIVTYGEPCTCKQPLPYSIQVPCPVHKPVDIPRSYGFAVETPPREIPVPHVALPLLIQTPIHKKPVHDVLSGKSYGVNVEYQLPQALPRSYSYDCAIQTPVVHHKKQQHIPPQDFAVQYAPRHVAPLLPPLPIAVQTPIHKPKPEDCRLTGLSTSVDKILLPACQYSGIVPDCTDIVTPRHNSRQCSCH